MVAKALLEARASGRKFVCLESALQDAHERIAMLQSELGEARKEISDLRARPREVGKESGSAK